MKQIELPPVWLAAFIAIAWAQSTYYPMGLSFGPVWADLLGGILVGGGLLLMLLAVVEFYRHKTTVVPRRESSAFVQSGIYRRTRNPIYLGDALVLAGLILAWDVLPALVLVPVFMALIARRYIAGEEAGLEAKFGAEFTEWKRKVRRWL